MAQDRSVTVTEPLAIPQDLLDAAMVQARSEVALEREEEDKAAIVRSGGLIDTPRDIWAEPQYQFAGSTMASQQIYECLECGALLKEAMAIAHTRLHRALFDVRDYTGRV